MEWWLGRNSAGHLNPKTHVQRFMRQEALWLVGEAMEAADKARVTRTLTTLSLTRTLILILILILTLTLIR